MKKDKKDKKTKKAKNDRIKPDDVLFVIDMQNDFLDRPYGKFKKGKLPTFGSKSIVGPIARLTARFAKKAKVVATRDYHPVKNPHCSFAIFGEHCAWKTKGSDIAHEIEKVLISRNKPKKNCSIVFKGFSSKIDSFGAFPYSKKLGLKRICGCSAKSCPVGLTGSYGLRKYVRYPTLLSKKGLIPISKILKSTSKKTNTLYICGVLGDFCVLDTAKNARAAGYKNVVILTDLIKSLRIVKKKKVVYPTTPKMWKGYAKLHGFKFMKSKQLKF